MGTRTGPAEPLIGLSRDQAFVGLTASAEHTLQERAFDLVAALSGTQTWSGIVSPTPPTRS